MRPPMLTKINFPTTYIYLESITFCHAHKQNVYVKSCSRESPVILLLYEIRAILLTISSPPLLSPYMMDFTLPFSIDILLAHTKSVPFRWKSTWVLSFYPSRQRPMIIVRIFCRGFIYVSMYKHTNSTTFLQPHQDIWDMIGQINIHVTCIYFRPIVFHLPTWRVVTTIEHVNGV